MKTPANRAPIPIPTSRRWQEFRTQILPVVVFLAVAATAAGVWSHRIAAPSLVAEAEAITAQVSSTQAGVLTTLAATPLQTVAAGQILGYVRPSEPEIASATLAVIRARIAALHAGVGPAVDSQRVALESSRLQLEWMQARVDLADLRAQLQLAEDNLRRQTELRSARIISEEVYAEALTSRNGLDARVTSQQTMVDRLAPVLDAMGAVEAGTSSPAPDAALRTAICVEEETLRLTELQLQPVPLRAPIDGTVTLITRRPGETVLAGDPVMTIAAPSSTRVVGYLRQPIAYEVPTGTLVEIRTRRGERPSAPATVLDVGSALEPIPPALLAALRIVTPESGLRLHFNAPAELGLHPGETVDVIIADVTER